MVTRIYRKSRWLTRTKPTAILSLIAALLVSASGAFASESLNVPGPYFQSNETGVVSLMSVGGNVKTPLGRVTKVFLTLSNDTDAQRFIRLSNRGITIRSAGICALETSRSYFFRDASVKGYYFVRRRDGSREAHITLAIKNWSARTYEKPGSALCG